ncbi:MAG: pantoate--beta-alanine ligase, partial [Solirubrobacteraceae bacterium]
TSAAVADGERSADALTAIAYVTMSELDVEPEYVALVSPSTLEPVEELDEPALLAVAAKVGSTRLIDNVTLYPVAQIDHSDEGPTSLATQLDRPAVHLEPATSRETQAICSA